MVQRTPTLSAAQRRFFGEVAAGMTHVNDAADLLLDQGGSQKLLRSLITALEALHEVLGRRPDDPRGVPAKKALRRRGHLRLIHSR